MSERDIFPGRLTEVPDDADRMLDILRKARVVRRVKIHIDGHHAKQFSFHGSLKKVPFLSPGRQFRVHRNHLANLSLLFPGQKVTWSQR